MKRLIISLLFLTLVGIGYYRWSNTTSTTAAPAAVSADPKAPVAPKGKQTVITGYVGASKMAMLESNLEIRKILLERYNLAVNPIKKGGVEMVTTEPLTGIDFIWPASQVEVDMYEQAGKPKVAVEAFFASPMVFYTWNKVLDGMQEHQYAFTDQGVVYVHTAKLFQAIVDKKSWNELGLPLTGAIKVSFSDPTKANSGLQYLILAGTVLSGSEILEDVPKVLPQLKQMVRQQGLMTSSTGDIFKNYLQQGVGSMPIVAGYENQLIEFFIANPESASAIQQSLRVAYPQPTLWSTHPIIAVTENGKKLIKALQDKEIQQLAWKAHGLRSMQSAADISLVKVGSVLPAVIPNAINSPATAIIQELKTKL